ncbi:MAG TPA: alpha/beta hydrolase [Candidatus Dormibacteraeota bacterium]
MRKERSSVQDKTILVKGRRFHFRDWGSDSSPALVLLHSLEGLAVEWDRLALALEARYHVLAFDQRGHGGSDWSEEYSWGTLEPDLASFVQELRLERLSLLGISMGGFPAWLYAARHPEAVTRLILVESGLQDPEVPATPRPVHVHQPSAGYDDPELAVKEIQAEDPLAQVSELRRNVLANLKEEQGKWTWRYDPSVGPRLRTAWVREEITPSRSEQWDLLSNVRCPTLLIYGALSSSREVMERMGTCIAGSQLVEIAGAGHEVHVHNPTALISEVRRFLLDDSI